MHKDDIEGSPWELIAELDPDRTEFNYLTSTQFILDRSKGRWTPPDSADSHR